MKLYIYIYICRYIYIYIYIYLYDALSPNMCPGDARGGLRASTQSNNAEYSGNNLMPMAELVHKALDKHLIDSKALPSIDEITVPAVISTKDAKQAPTNEQDLTNSECPSECDFVPRCISDSSSLPSEMCPANFTALHDTTPETFSISAKWLVDTGCGKGLLADKHVSEFNHKPVSVEAVNCGTANGSIWADKGLNLRDEALGTSPSCPCILKSTPAILSVGLR